MKKLCTLLGAFIASAFLAIACGGSAPTSTILTTPVPTSTSTPSPEAVIAFPDSNLETAIRLALGKGTGEEMTARELAKLSELDTPHYPPPPPPPYITDLSGLEYLTNLASFNLRYNRISDISPLTNLTNLATLDLSENQIADLSPLVRNGGLRRGDTVILSSGYLDLFEAAENLAAIRDLEARGVEVSR